MVNNPLRGWGCGNYDSRGGNRNCYPGLLGREPVTGWEDSGIYQIPFANLIVHCIVSVCLTPTKPDRPENVHLLVGIKGGHSVANVVRELKKSSNGWVREQTGFSNFNWQEGFIASQVGHRRTGHFRGN